MTESKQARLQRHRLQMTLLTVVNSLLQSVVIGLFAASGATTWPLAAAFAVASLVTTGLFALAVARGWVLRLGDARLLHAQLAVNFVVQIAFLIAIPTLWIVFLASTLITCSYAMVALTPRQFTWLWLAYGLATGLALFAGRERFGTPAPTAFNIAILWLFFFMGVRRLAVTGAQFSRLREQLSEKNRQLTVLLERNQAMATHDELTGAFNRRHLMGALADERERARRSDAAFSLAIFDLDWFKAINDGHGHAGGDAVLKAFCDLARAELRANDLFARYGGEEFVLLMPATPTPEAARSVVERVRHAVAAHDWRTVLGGQARGVTVSAGVAMWRSDESPETVLARADAALYDAKHRGRNRSVIAASVADDQLAPA
ncbi:MAG: GGDEF domain-containing protein [Burkholderiales bacterium]|nr:GGDEF domain-containing protein [Burkholderiales bacterium]